MDNDMQPTQSPVGVRRVNKLPSYIFFAILGGFACAVYYAGEHLDDWKVQAINKDEQESKASMSAESMALEVLGSEPVARNNVAVIPQSPPDKVQEQPQEPPKDTPRVETKEEQELVRIQQLKQQEFEEANKADTNVQWSQQNHDQPNKKDAVVAALGKTEGDRWKLGNRLEAPESDYMIRAGTVIPAIMVSGINSDLPGKLIAQVSQNVYDTATGKHLLIPQGTKPFGEYANDIIYGQEAVMVAWQRLTFPDAKVLDIGEMPGADGAGYSGFRDQVNHHYPRIFGAALLMSAISAGTALSQNSVGNTGGFGQQQNANTVMSQVLGQQLGQVGQQIIGKNLNIAPTIEIRPGYRFNIVVVKDIVLPSEYRNFDYKR